MKNWKNIYSVIVVSVVILTLVYAFLLAGGRFMLAAKLSSLLGRKVTIEKIILKPPLDLEIKGLDIGGLAKVDYIYLSPSIPYLLTGKLALNKVRIIRPKITCEGSLPLAEEKSPAASSVQPAQEQAKTEEQEANAQAEEKGRPRLIIRSLKVRGGEIYFIDHTPDLKTVTVVLKNVDFNMKNLYSYPVDLPADFQLKGNIPWQSGEPDGDIYLEGWINFFKRDMLANLDIKNIDAIAFLPYYSEWVDLEGARIEKAKLSFTSKIIGKDNDVAAECHLELVDIVRKVRTPQEHQEKAEVLTDTVLDIFKSLDRGKVILNFTLHTKMDQPRFSFNDIKSAFEDKLMRARANAGLRAQDMLLLPGKMIQKGFKSGAEISKAMIDGVFALGSGLKKVLDDVINRQTPEE